MLNRRRFLAASAAGAAFIHGPAFADAPAGDARLAALFDAFFQENLEASPESATQLGLDKGRNAGLKFKLSPRDPAQHARDAARVKDQLTRLQAIDRKGLSETDTVNYDTVLYALTTSERLSAFDFGGRSYGPSPYVICQMTGAYQAVPEFLDTKHRIETKEDADAYVARLEQYATVLDQETDRLAAESARGILPPDFLLDETLIQLRQGAVPAGENKLVQSLARRAAAKGLSDAYAKRATALYDRRIAPALARQIAAVEKARTGAQHQPGVWRFDPHGEFYAACLQSATTTRLPPEDIHEIGLDQGRAISGRINALLKTMGLTTGTVGERIQGLYKDPSLFFGSDAAGKARLIAYCNERLEAMRQRLPQAFKRIPPYKFEVRAVPADIDTGAPLAYSQAPSLDGRPGIVYFNLHDTAEWPRWDLPTTVYHEGLPGHQLESGLALANPGLPLIRKSMGFSAYAEGWALYTEQLADELGMYDDDPLGRIGYLKGQLFRCGRLVVDTGIHHMRWSREQAVAYLTGLDGDAVGSTTREIDRYCAIPGQACSYKIGHNTWVAARDRARNALREHYDIRDFHEVGLGCGRVPLEVLEDVIDRWIIRTRA
jgi:uncharacterized protein (DUF885 family)